MSFPDPRVGLALALALVCRGRCGEAARGSGGGAKARAASASWEKPQAPLVVALPHPGPPQLLAIPEGRRGVPQKGNRAVTGVLGVDRVWTVGARVHAEGPLSFFWMMG